MASIGRKLLQVFHSTHDRFQSNGRQKPCRRRNNNGSRGECNDGGQSRPGRLHARDAGRHTKDDIPFSCRRCQHEPYAGLSPFLARLPQCLYDPGLPVNRIGNARYVTPSNTGSIALPKQHKPACRHAVCLLEVLTRRARLSQACLTNNPADICTQPILLTHEDARCQLISCSLSRYLGHEDHATGKDEEHG